MNIKEIVESSDKSYTPPTINVGDEIKVGKFKNRKTEVTGFSTDDHNQPVLKTTKGDQISINIDVVGSIQKNASRSR